MKFNNAFISICLLFLLAFSTTVNATTWLTVKDLPDGSIFYIDKTSVRQDGVKEGDKRKIHTLISYKTLQTNVDGAHFISMSFIELYSCSKRTHTTLSSIEYEGENGTGKIIYKHKMGFLVAYPINAGTLDEHVMEYFVCDMDANYNGY